MLNLTSRNETLAAADGREPTTVRREGPRAAECIHEGLILTGEHTDPGCGPIETARLAGATPAQVENLNRLLEEHIRKDEATTGRKGLVLIERELLRHVHPRLRDRVAAPISRDDEAEGGKARVTMLVFPPEPYAAPGTAAGAQGVHALPRPRGAVHDDADRPGGTRAHVGAAAVARARRRALRARRAALGVRRRTQHRAAHERHPAGPAAARSLNGDNRAKRTERTPPARSPDAHPQRTQRYQHAATDDTMSEAQRVAGWLYPRSNSHGSITFGRGQRSELRQPHHGNAVQARRPARAELEERRPPQPVPGTDERVDGGES